MATQTTVLKTGRAEEIGYTGGGARTSAYSRRTLAAACSALTSSTVASCSRMTSAAQRSSSLSSPA